MLPQLSYKRLSLTFLTFFAFLIGRADTLTLPLPAKTQTITLQPWLSVLETTDPELSASVLTRHPGLFVPLDSLHPKQATDYYWLRTNIHTDTNQPAQNLILSFTSLTFVDVYLFNGASCILHKQLGAFRKRSDIADEDGRFFATLPFESGKDYNLLLQVHHTKHYDPIFDFTLQSRKAFYTARQRRELWDAALQGAIGIFLLYTLLSWWGSRYKIYAWLAIFIVGCGGFVIASNGYLTEWFLPEAPATAWLFNINFLELGFLGLYLLISGFWEVKKKYPIIHRYTRFVPYVLITTAITCNAINITTGNFNLSNSINLWEHPILIVLIIYTLLNCWRQLTHPQRYLAYGMMLFGFSGLAITLNSVFRHEQALASAPLIADFVVLGVFLLFSIGLKEQMRQHEIDKGVVLKELTELQQHQNELLEKKVEERTEELNVSNRRLIKQKNLLTERNHKIEILINELNHRVKNNLQLLYSLLSLQLPIVRDDASRDILKGNIGKIRAMMLVNQKLFSFEKEGSIGLCEFIDELATHLQKIYDSKGKTLIRQEIPASLRLSDKQTLSFGLILSELFTNTFKHAFHDHPNPCIKVEVVPIGITHLQFIYSDNGRGIQEGDAREKFTMGIPLIKDLTRQMNGQMVLSTEGGLSYTFTIPV